jgi:hypothetical protein
MKIFNPAVGKVDAPCHKTPDKNEQGLHERSRIVWQRPGLTKAALPVRIEKRKQTMFGFENKYTKAFFMTGLNGLKQALIPETLEIVLEFLSVQISRERDISAQELFEICLLKKLGRVHTTRN